MAAWFCEWESPPVGRAGTPTWFGAAAQRDKPYRRERHASHGTGYSTVSYGRARDGEASVFVAVTPATLLAPVAHEWSGEACTTSALQSQIRPATRPPTYDLCPPTS